MRVRFTPSARAQFLAAIDRIRRENRPAALRFRRVAGVQPRLLGTG